MKKTTAKTPTHDKPELYKSYNDEESYDFPDYEDPDHDVISSRNDVVNSRNYVTDHRDDVMNSKNGGGRRGQPFHSRQKRKCRSDDYYDDVIQRCLHCETVCSPKFKMKLDCPECPDYKPSEMSSFHLPNQATTLKNTSKSEVFLATNKCEEKLTAPRLADGEICNITDISRQKYDVINHNINYNNVSNNSTKLTYPVNRLFNEVIVKTRDRYGPNFNNNDNINSSNNNKNNIVCKYNNFEHANNINANIANNNNNNNNNNSSPNNINNKIINNNITNKNNINTNNNINNNNNNNNNVNNNNFAIVDNNATSSLDFYDSYYSLHSDVIIQENNKNNKNNNKSNNKNNNNNRCCNDCNNYHNHNNYKII
ncbi:hypothetical protein HELRODRAFT_177047 [Helobdella robusta]|uniref:Uncharacterized protein n=1 Tax=Helobdella robusta TaxID=6412 RepID=T1FB64_HELRO|nr:hypothetical protein HELRODRAFT_177047 [Helobdella robusta]ESN98568.1 hypothetical protein HELRODRAFT_177047 [Helobdella robusta]